MSAAVTTSDYDANTHAHAHVHRDADADADANANAGVNADAGVSAHTGVNADADVEVGLKSDANSAHAPKYLQHDDPDVIIPDKISRPLVISAHLLLVTAGVSVFRDKRYDLASVLLAVYITSIFHWSAPRFSSISRRADYLAVCTAVSYGTYVSTTLELELTLVWCIGVYLFACVILSFYYSIMACYCFCWYC